MEALLSQKMDEMNQEVMSNFDDEEVRRFKKMFFDIGISNKNKEDGPKRAIILILTKWLNYNSKI